ncbi:J domain-containing protein [Cupriavidus necator]|uniref:J domain-containing protein n=1 Tax=Cupriavidus necator TaxID=106590 RepID=A0A367PQ05_CUPNE|nr:J domain-containing protein [Cupriavidus necator]RCJ10001.1 J domain-containing protein [Cupriavidus necator]
MDSDYYHVLGLNSGASQADIRHAYRRLAMRWHPDRNQGTAKQAEEVFKSVQQAYSALKDPVVRAAYDAERAGKAQAKDSHPHTGQPAPDPPQRTGTRGADYICETTVPLETAVLGGVGLTKINMKPACGRCAGNGQLRAICVSCHGRGTLARSFIGKENRCVPCSGIGWQSHRCEACLGAGHTHAVKVLRVKIPTHTLDGTVLRGTGLGGKSVDGGPPGDLLCKVKTRADRTFSVNGLDLTRELKIDFVLASLGGQISTARFRKLVDVKIPPMTHSGAVIRVPKQGLHNPSRRRTGDLLLKVVIDLPSKMRIPDERQRAVLRELARGYRADYDS